MKLIKSIFYFLLFLLVTASVSKDQTPGMGLSEGSTVPELSLLTADVEPKLLSSYRGKSVFLQFWASSNVESRIKNAQINNVLKAQKDLPIKMVSVSFDPSSEVARHMGQMDGLLPEELFTVNSQLKRRTMSRFRMEPDRYTNYLLNEQGVIIGRNLSVSDLKKKLNL